MIIQRKMYGKLIEWKEQSKGRRAILIEGARRIGKSTVAEEFARKEYSTHLIIDFAKEDMDVEFYFEKYIGEPPTS